MPKCQYCLTPFSSGRHVRSHQQQAAKCRKSQDKALALALKNSSQRAKRGEKLASQEPELTPMDIDSVPDNAFEMEGESNDPSDSVVEDVEDEADVDAIPPRIVEIPDVDAPRPRKTWKQAYPASRNAGKGLKKSPTKFDQIRDEQILTGAQIWGPFRDEEEWELAKWLIKNVGHTQADTLLKLPIVR